MTKLKLFDNNYNALLEMNCDFRYARKSVVIKCLTDGNRQLCIIMAIAFPTGHAPSIPQFVSLPPRCHICELNTQYKYRFIFVLAPVS